MNDFDFANHSFSGFFSANEDNFSVQQQPQQQQQPQDGTIPSFGSGSTMSQPFFQDTSVYSPNNNPRMVPTSLPSLPRLPIKGLLLERLSSLDDSSHHLDFSVHDFSTLFDWKEDKEGKAPAKLTTSNICEAATKRELNSMSTSTPGYNCPMTPHVPDAAAPVEPTNLFFTQDSSQACREYDLRTMLHRACQQYPRKKKIIQAALRKDLSAVRRRALIPGLLAKRSPSSSSTSSHNENKYTSPCPPEPYQLPINIALAHNASLDVLDLLVKADPTQLIQKDGIHGVNSLCLALEKRPNDAAVLGLFMVTVPELVLGGNCCDDNGNTPLHVACQRGSSLAIVLRLYQLSPTSLQHRNANGQTPLDVLQTQVQYSDRAMACFKCLQERATKQTTVKQQQQELP